MGYREHEWGYGLDQEVCGEGVLLEDAELGTGEDAKSDYARDEGLVECATQEGTIAGVVSRRAYQWMLLR